jgi:hypothetical protein
MALPATDAAMPPITARRFVLRQHRGRNATTRTAWRWQFSRGILAGLIHGEDGRGFCS